jgi:hypothetical protein
MSYDIVQGIETSPTGVIIDYKTCKRYVPISLIARIIEDGITQIGCRIEFGDGALLAQFNRTENADEFMEWLLTL